MPRETILSRLQELPGVEIFEETEDTVLVYDSQLGNDILYSFSETFTRQKLQEKIVILSPMPEYAQLDTAALADYLWKYMDHNAFLTLDRLWFVNRPEDYNTIAAHYHDGEVSILAEVGAKGCMWFRYQACIVDVNRIQKYVAEIARGFQGIAQFDAPSEIRRRIVAIAIHELRHLMLDTNIVLPIEEYPRELSGEFLVERYAQEVYQESDASRIFHNEGGK